MRRERDRGVPSFFFLPPDSLKSITGESFRFPCFCSDVLVHWEDHEFFRVSVGLPASLSVCLSVCRWVLQFLGTQFFVIPLVCCGRILRGVFVGGRRKLIFVSSILFLCCRLQIFIYVFLFWVFFVFWFISQSLGCCGGVSSLVPILGLDGGNENLLISSVSFLVCLLLLCLWMASLLSFLTSGVFLCTCIFLYFFFCNSVSRLEEVPHYNFLV